MQELERKQAQERTAPERQTLTRAKEPTMSPKQEVALNESTPSKTSGVSHPSKEVTPLSKKNDSTPQISEESPIQSPQKIQESVQKSSETPEKVKAKSPKKAAKK